ncbi:MAG: 4'-phosphopantetheinyl transferase superfamily protein [Vicingaceae bacterium]|jgi:4'-phosphopantetheinyl transferase|nr:hypothetical protein [Flavobacteriales bacterium]MDF1675239.1 4'-phosphopantetheinyl transferase superfamily protein [Vicingaceae bacterium]|tara:strand:+ start:33237 stop:33857 length:621 start_codon:yes stop_codon:yes gene_type:complete
MPLFLIKKPNNHVDIAVWKISESQDELLEMLKDKVSEPDDAMTSSNQSKFSQRIAVRLLLAHFFDSFTLEYDDKGKPHLADQEDVHISISHANEFVAIAVNYQEPCGVDIEKISAKALRVKNKFMNEKELDLVAENEELATTMWSAKEALYKYYGRKEVIFDTDLSLTNLSLTECDFIGSIKLNGFEKQLNLKKEKIESFMLVYTC